MGRISKPSRAKFRDRNDQHVERPLETKVDSVEGEKRPDWIARGISILALVLAVPSTMLAINQYLTSRPGVDLTDVGTPTIEIFGNEADVYLVGTYQFVLVNKSSQAVSIVGVDCSATIRSRVGNLDYCKVAMPESQSTLAINLDAHRAALINIAFRITADEDVQKLHKEYKQEKTQFNDSEFLLYLASKSTDFFGTKFDRPYSYLQTTFGKGLCLGGQISVRAAGEDLLTKDLDFYVGPFQPIMDCNANNSEGFVIHYSDHYGEQDFFNGDPGPKVLSN